MKYLLFILLAININVFGSNIKISNYDTTKIEQVDTIKKSMEPTKFNETKLTRNKANVTAVAFASVYIVCWILMILTP